MDALSWRPLGEADLPALTALAGACLSADGGQPFADSPPFLGSCYLADARTYAGFDAAVLVCVSSLREPAPGTVPANALPAWGQADPARFHAVYEASFRERPGFPGWPRARWIERISDDEDFRADWTLLATVGGADAGFVVAAAGGWIAQVGVVPAARGANLGALLIAEAVRRMRSAGETTITLNVNVNNPRAAALYRRLGFIRAGRRAKYEVADPASPAGPSGQRGSQVRRSRSAAGSRTGASRRWPPISMITSAVRARAVPLPQAQGLEVGVPTFTWFTQFGTDVSVNFVRPSLVQTLSFSAALVMHSLNACCSAGGTMAWRQLTSSVRPEEEASPLTPVFEMQAVACSFAFATADDDATGVVVPDPLPGLLVVLLLQPAIAAAVIAANTAAAITVRTCCFPDITNPPGMS